MGNSLEQKQVTLYYRRAQQRRASEDRLLSRASAEVKSCINAHYNLRAA